MQVPVEARVGSGEVVIELRLLSPYAASPIGEPQSADVTVRADWEGIGLVILAVLIGGFLTLGIVRTVLRRRAARRRGCRRRWPTAPSTVGTDDAATPRSERRRE